MHAVRSVLLAAALCASAACTRQDARLQQHREVFESLGATTEAIGQAWLSGAVSGTYTSTALKQTLLLVEQERTALGQQPNALLDPRGAQLADAAGRLSRLLAVMMHEVEAADADAVRRQLAALPIAPPTPR